MNWNEIHEVDVLTGLKKITASSVDCVIIDPPYNIGYDFGNNKCKKEIQEYVEWSLSWIQESKRILKPSGTMFIYGFSEILAHLSIRLEMDHRWLIWHYTNKTTPSSKFWQRSHESIICAWKNKTERIFNLDKVREPYTEGFKKGYGSGKKIRPNTKGRFNNMKEDSAEEKKTYYKVNEIGALPRDVFKISTLAGGSGAKSRIAFCKKCDVAILGKKERKFHEQHEETNKDKKNTIINHPTQKPFEVSKRLMLSCMPEYGKIVIPFAGSGSECLVAKKLNFEFIGFDLNPEYVRMSNKLIEKKDIKL